jgi:hypothetical protein
MALFSAAANSVDGGLGIKASGNVSASLSLSLSAKKQRDRSGQWYADGRAEHLRARKVHHGMQTNCMRASAVHHGMQ